MDVVTKKAENPPKQPTQVKEKRKVSGFSCLNLPSTLSPLFEELDFSPGLLRTWPDKDEDIPVVGTKYWLVPQGSVLSYKQQ